jgi:hypothetical protein
MALTVNSKLRDLMENPESKAILEKHMGDLIKDPRMKSAYSFPLKMCFKMAPKGVIPPGAAEAVEADLNKLSGA